MAVLLPSLCVKPVPVPADPGTMLSLHHSFFPASEISCRMTVALIRGQPQYLQILQDCIHAVSIIYLLPECNPN